MFHDNEAVENALRSGKIGNNKTMNLLKWLMNYCYENDIRLIPQRITSEENKIADAGSRLEWKKFVDALKNPSSIFEPKLWEPYPIPDEHRMTSIETPNSIKKKRKRMVGGYPERRRKRSKTEVTASKPGK